MIFRLVCNAIFCFIVLVVSFSCGLAERRTGSKKGRSNQRKSHRFSDYSPFAKKMLYIAMVLLHLFLELPAQAKNEKLETTSSSSATVTPPLDVTPTGSSTGSK
ncbi:unnamed protein product [Cylicocyclus nassatus]|uniref:Secreted protein n=1 Tax=Cylicocyclus nassatus TaxID=53992 RepID=A0AA36HCD2_CYLNA|nr:unnamed protein product [Cylicocyclus nassatus]